MYWGSSVGLLWVPVEHQGSWGGLVELGLEPDSGPPSPLDMRDGDAQQQEGEKKKRRKEKKREKEKDEERGRVPVKGPGKGRGFPLKVQVKTGGAPVNVWLTVRGRPR